MFLDSMSSNISVLPIFNCFGLGGFPCLEPRRLADTGNPEPRISSSLPIISISTPTHQSPIPPQLLSFLSEYYGFDRVKTVRLQESKELITGKRPLSLHNVLGGVSPDYAVIAQKAADHDIFHAVDTAFNTEYGLSLAMLAAHYDEQLEAKAQQVEVKAQEAEARAGQAEAKAQEAHAKAQEAEARAGQAEAKAQEAHAKAQEAEARAGQAEAKAQEARRPKAQEADKRVQGRR
ncbi:MAG: hypothetical protein U5J82_09370 [Desulfobacterales bacterium]|nr:hypothetical protein [Desulfobacterales bacterium]